MDAEHAPLLTLPQAARQLGVTRSTLHRWLRQGVAHGEWLGAVWVLSAEEVARLQAQGRRRRGVPAGSTLPRTVPGTCVVCGAAFTATRPARYCSRRCAVRAWRARLRGG